MPATRYVIYGAGAIGGTIGARLHMAGEAVVLIARGEHARALAESGMEFVHPGGKERLQIPVVTHPRELESGPDDRVLLCMKSQHTAGALTDMCATGLNENPVFCVQNGVANERLAARVCPRVYATVVNLPAMHLEPGRIASYADAPGGVLDTARYPGSADALATDFCAALTKAGFSAAAVATVMAQKYAKLLVNLGNALELLLGDSADYRPAGKTLRAEALACFAAAGIDYVPLREYIERNNRIYTSVDLAAAPRQGGSTYQSLQRGAAEVETDYLNGEIVLLGQLHEVPTPANALVQRLARDVISGKLEPRSMRWAELWPESGADKSR